MNVNNSGVRWLLWSVAAMTAVQTVLLISRMSSPDSGGLQDVLLVVGVVGASTLLGVLAAPRRNIGRIAHLRAAHPDAVVFGAQAEVFLDDRVAELMPSPPGQKTSFGQLVTVMVDAEGVSFWKGRAAKPERRALIPWERISAVSVGSVHLARELHSVRFEVTNSDADPVSIDVVPNREGLWAYTAILDKGRVQQTADAVQRQRPNAGSRIRSVDATGAESDRKAPEP